MDSPLPSPAEGIRDIDPGPVSPPPRRLRPVKTSLCSSDTFPAAVRLLDRHMREKVWAVYRQLGGTRGLLDDHRRRLLAEAVHQIEDDLERREPGNSLVLTLRGVRSRLYDDLGWNQHPSPRREVSHAA